MLHAVISLEPMSFGGTHHTLPLPHPPSLALSHPASIPPCLYPTLPLSHPPSTPPSLYPTLPLSHPLSIPPSLYPTLYPPLLPSLLPPSILPRLSPSPPSPSSFPLSFLLPSLHPHHSIPPPPNTKLLVQFSQRLTVKTFSLLLQEFSCECKPLGFSSRYSHLLQRQWLPQS